MDKAQQLELAKQIAAKHGTGQQLNTSGKTDFSSKWNSAFSDTPVVKQPTFGGKIVRGIANDFARLGNTVTAPVRGAIDKVAGFDPQGDIIDPYAGNVTGYGMKEGQTTSQRAKDIVGGVATTASNVVGGGVAADIVKAGVKGAVKQGAIQGAKAGTLAGFGSAMQNDKGVGETILDTAVGGLTGGVVGGIAGGVAPTIKAIPKLPKAVSSLKPSPDEIMNRVARLDPTDARAFQKMTGMSHGEYLAKSGNMYSPQTVIENESKKFIQSLNTADTEIAKLPGVYKSEALNTAINDLAERELRVSTPGALSPDYEVVKELSNKFHNGGGLTMEEVNLVKRLYEKNVKLGFDRQTQSEQIARATNIDNALRSWQFKKAEELGLKNLPEINKQTQTAKFIVDKLGKKLLGQSGNNALSLTDYIMLSGGDATSVSGFLTKKIFSSPRVQASIARMISSKPTINQVTGEATPTVENALRRGFPKGTPLMLQSASSEFKSKIPSTNVIKVAPNKNFETVGKAPMATRSTQLSQPVSKKLESTYTNTIPPKTGKVNQVINTLRDDIKNNGQRGSVEVFKNSGNLTTKILKDLEGKTTVSKQYILDATNRGELKQTERDITRQVLDTMPDGQINVKEFAKRIKSELLPLKRNDDLSASAMGGYKYENITLPDELRGNVENYSENIYESPIKTSAGEVHFSGDTKNYFGHTRIEDMADNKTRRVIEVQSDLYQKGNLEREIEGAKGAVWNRAKISEVMTPEDLKKYNKNWKITEDYYNKKIGKPEDTIKANSEIQQLEKKYTAVLNEEKVKSKQKLQQYNDPTAHFRMVREEIKKAAQDGKTKLQFPTGETAMKIEGLGEQRSWFNADNRTITPEELKVGETAYQITPQSANNAWIITDVLGDGKFKAIPKRKLNDLKNNLELKRPDTLPLLTDLDVIKNANLIGRDIESFDISGKVDTNNPIYKFYEKDVQKYLNKFGGKRVVDDKGVSWIEIPIAKEQGKAPVEAFGNVQLGLLPKVAGVTALGVLGANLYNNKKK